MAITLIKCNCTGNPSNGSAYQSKKYGEGTRVCNLDAQKKNATCTVCGKKHTIK